MNELQRKYQSQIEELAAAANRLAELGFVVGAQVKVVSEMGGNLILSVKDSRIALDKAMAMRIMV